jgi:hypothetical protein
MIVSVVFCWLPAIGLTIDGRAMTRMGVAVVATADNEIGRTARVKRENMLVSEEV